MDSASFGLKLLEIFTPVALAFGTLCSARLARTIRAKAEAAHLSGALVRIDDSIVTTIKDLEQSMVRRLKATSPNGKLTDEQQAQLRRAALDAVHARLGS